MSQIPQLDQIGAASTKLRGAPPSLWAQLRVWIALGVQSFGGGTATLYLIRRAVVDQRRWLSEEEFTRDWSLCFLAPGINLLCLTVLVGRRVGGALGIALALVGLLLPSVTLTILMTALYASAQRLGVVQAALRGVVPGTVGLGVLLALRMARPLLAASRRESRGSLVLSGGILLGSGLTVALWHPPVIAILCGAGALGALGAWRHAARGGRP
jgi:chromate transporter